MSRRLKIVLAFGVLFIGTGSAALFYYINRDPPKSEYEVCVDNGGSLFERADIVKICEDENHNSIYKELTEEERASLPDSVDVSVVHKSKTLSSLRGSEYKMIDGSKVTLERMRVVLGKASIIPCFSDKPDNSFVFEGTDLFKDFYVIDPLNSEAETISTITLTDYPYCEITYTLGDGSNYAEIVGQYTAPGALGSQPFDIFADLYIGTNGFLDLSSHNQKEIVLYIDLPQVLKDIDFTKLVEGQSEESAQELDRALFGSLRFVAN